MRISHFQSIITSFALACVTVQAKPTLQHSSDPLQAQVYKLDNGLTVYLSKNSQSPTIYAEIAVRCGSYHDPQNATGMAHYLEHLMFKGTKKIGTLDYQKEKKHLATISELYEEHRKATSPEKRKEIYKKINAESKIAAQFAIANDMDRIYKNIGGKNVNAHTSYDETVYKVELPSNQLERWVKIESERFSDPVFRLFHTELETVYEEKNASLDDSGDQAFNTLQRTLYPDHPYGETILGKPKHLKNPSIVELHRHLNQYYVPNNMAVIISGDIDIESALKVVESHFGSMPKKDLNPNNTPSPNLLKGVNRVKLTFEGEESINMAWRTVGKNHPDAPALELFDMILDNQVAGLINLNLQQPQRVRSAGSYPLLLNHAGAQYFYATPRKGQSLLDLEKLIIEQVDLVKQGKFEDWILDAIKADLKKSDLLATETNAGRVSKMRRSFLASQTWGFATQRHSRYAKVTKNDIMQVANRYFGGDYAVVHLQRGKSNLQHVEKPQIDPVPINSDTESKFAKAIYATPTQAIKPKFIQQGVDYTEQTDAQGIHYITTKNPINSLFSVTWSIPRGSMHDNKIDIALQTLKLSGTKDLNLTELQKQWYKLGVTVRTEIREADTTLTIAGPQASFEEALKLFNQWSTDPNISPQTLNDVVLDVKENRKDRQNKPNVLSHAMARHSRFGNQSRYLLELSSAQLDALTVKDLNTSLSSLFSTAHTVNYIGTLSSNQWREKLPKRTITSQSSAIKKQPLKTKNAIQIQFLHREMAQSQVWIESFAKQWDRSDLPKLELFNEYFDGGMSGIVFQEMREARGLAYSAYGYSAEPRWPEDPWVNVGIIGCQADKTNEAIEQFITLFDSMPISQTRFDESKEALLTRFGSERVPFREIGKKLLKWKQSDYQTNANQFVFEHLQKADFDTLQSFYKKHIANRPKRICIVGDKNRIDMEKLKKIGTFEELKAGDIFSQ